MTDVSNFSSCMVIMQVCNFHRSYKEQIIKIMQPSNKSHSVRPHILIPTIALSAGRGGAHGPWAWPWVYACLMHVCETHQPPPHTRMHTCTHTVTHTHTHTHTRTHNTHARTQARARTCTHTTHSRTHTCRGACAASQLGTTLVKTQGSNFGA